MHAKELLLDQSSNTEGIPLFIEEEDLEVVAGANKRPRKLDHDGLTVEALNIYACERPSIICTTLSLLTGSTNACRDEQVIGRAMAKRHGTIPASKIRAILPLPTLLIYLDIILARRIQDIVDKCLPPLPGVWVGARRKRNARMSFTGSNSFLRRASMTKAMP